MSRPTVKIESNDFECGYLIINESDFDETTMKLYEEAALVDDSAGGDPDTDGESETPKELSKSELTKLTKAELVEKAIAEELVDAETFVPDEVTKADLIELFLK